MDQNFTFNETVSSSFGDHLLRLCQALQAAQAAQAESERINREMENE